ncbi:hypothetical protein HYH02_000337 [Chlamydomonas schloesseri]|uniref:Uncharacterized protein n=1 Tax=Chlamydomonas schloesseri TaxID=2026947 RepID=A0A835WP82_9CHLO|nr:hypothetical protein HYH02_000337 [Chlamydomonas schloesseri]|eukprot:KAG2450240.1 hypothetical protein HYH02_000337 [Chlamydomonas schloesseri]
MLQARSSLQAAAQRSANVTTRGATRSLRAFPRHGQQGRIPHRGPTPPAAVGRTAYSVETQRLLKCILTRQAIKTTMNYLSETNGELHFFLHNYWAEHPLAVDPAVDADEWLVQLAATPWTKVQDPRRSSVVSAAAQAAVMNGEREVSPREVAERIMRLREHIAKEMAEDLARVPADNTEVLKRTLTKTFTEVKPPL